MKTSIQILTILGVISLSSCVSKKKYVALEEQLQNTQSNLQRTTAEKEDLEGRFALIEARVADYNAKINSLTDANNSQMVMVDDIAVISNNTKDLSLIHI